MRRKARKFTLNLVGKKNLYIYGHISMHIYIGFELQQSGK